MINNLQIFTRPENLDKFTAAADNINHLSGQLDNTVQLLDTLIRENRSEVRQAVMAASVVAGRLDTTTMSLNEAIYSINNIVQSDTINQILGNAHDVSQHLKDTDLKLFIDNLAEISKQTGQLLYRIDQELDMNSRELTESMRILRITLSNLEETTNKINADPSVLIRGFGDKNVPDKRLEKK